MASRTGVPEDRADALHRAKELRDLAAYSKTMREANLYEALARIRNREGVSLTRHSFNAGEFVDYFIDDLIDEMYADDERATGVHSAPLERERQT